MITAITATLLLTGAQSNDFQGVTSGITSKIPTKTLKMLQTSGYRVLVPTYIPSGFVMSECNLEKFAEKYRTVFDLTYENKKTKAFFCIQMASDGLGDPFFDFPDGSTVDRNGFFFAKHPLWGKFTIDTYKASDADMFHFTWLPIKTKDFPQYLMIFGERMTSDQVQKVVASLRYLKRLKR